MARKTRLNCCIALIYFAFRFVLTLSAPESARVTKIPGFNGTLPSKHYAGYVTVDENHGRRLYYYFVVSERNPSKDPVVLWLNGGPGCSSFDGFVYEHGPFNFQMGKTSGSLPTLHLNPHSWSKVSNILYLDSPAGVGLSYSENKSDYETGDIKTAFDSHTFLLKWFELYPEFLPNPFYISGESYAGVYVPTLAYEVAKGIDAGVKPGLNFKGYMVGNGVADDQFDGNALVPFVHGMGLISDDLYEYIEEVLAKLKMKHSGITSIITNDDGSIYCWKVCGVIDKTANSLKVDHILMSYIDPNQVTSDCRGNYYNPTSENCESTLAKIDEAIDGLNIYDILEPCYHDANPIRIPTNDTKLPLSFRMLGETERPLPVRKRMFGRAWPLRAPVRDGIVPTWPQLLNSNSVPCTDDEVATAWLNNEAVREAIHAEPVNVADTWELCTGRITFNHDSGSMIKYHKNLTAKGYRALIFSGDHDMCVPFTGSEAWTRSVGYKIVDEWRAWFFNEQVAGYIQGYEHNLTFLTIKGAGHTVPEYKPREALEFYTRWLEGKKI